MSDDNKQRIVKGVLQIRDGESYWASMPEDYERCCDCGLTHKIRFQIYEKNGIDRIKGARLKVTVWRDERATSATRRAFKFRD